MSDEPKVLQFKPRAKPSPYPIIYKTVDGEVIECVDIDALAPEQRAEYFREKPTGA
jgi:hypothetical protein